MCEDSAKDELFEYWMVPLHERQLDMMGQGRGRMVKSVNLHDSIIVIEKNKRPPILREIRNQIDEYYT
ncbi:MAG: hypothetical protein ACR2OR_01820 [Hyphomicrobiales bacterium]